MANGGKRTTRISEMRGVLKRWERSGLPLSRFADGEGIVVERSRHPSGRKIKTPINRKIKTPINARTGKDQKDQDTHERQKDQDTHERADGGCGLPDALASIIV